MSALALPGYAVSMEILVTIFRTMRHRGQMRISHYVLYKGTPLGHFEWNRDVAMSAVTPGVTILIVAIKLPVGHVTIVILPALPIGGPCDPS